MIATRIACASLAISILLSATSASAAPANAIPPEQKQKLASLRMTALGEDRMAARKAINELLGLGDVAKPTLVEVLPKVLVRDKSAIEENLRKISALGDLKQVETDVANQRKAALARIEKLATAADTTAARADYTRLTATVKRLNDMYAARSTVVDIARHRPDLLGLWKDIAPKNVPNPIDPAMEQKLATSIQQGLGESLYPVLKDLSARKLETNDPLPNGPEQAGFYYYRLRRQTEAYNKSLAAQADPGELELVRLINGYRDVLGLPPLEMDARLLQAARRHSKEMVDLKFFSPTSPTPENKDALTRLKNAGFNHEGEWSEALGRNTTTPVQTFWAMFDQPPYHKGMISSTTSAIGVGKWNQYWTIDIATGPRLMLATEEQRNNAQVAGNFQAPQTAAAVSSSGSRTGAAGGNDGGPMTDPTKIRIPNTGGAGHVPGVPSIPGLGGF